MNTTVEEGCCCHFSYHAEQVECGLCHGLCDYALETAPDVRQTMYDDYVASVLEEQDIDPWLAVDDTEF